MSKFAGWKIASNFYDAGAIAFHYCDSTQLGYPVISLMSLLSMCQKVICVICQCIKNQCI